MEIEYHLVLPKEFLEARCFVEGKCNTGLWFVLSA